jgi:SAM-dependent methyltransferase
MMTLLSTLLLDGAERTKERLRPAVNRAVRNLPSRSVRWGTLRRTTPFSSCYGWDRGTPIDRFYIERFLQREAAAIRGDVMEVRDAAYARRFGGERVTRTHVVDIDEGNRKATLIADLTRPGALPDEAYDAIVMTQTLHITTDDRQGFRTLWAALRPGGTILFSGPFVGRIDHESPEHDHWRYTPNGLRRTLAEVLPGADVHVEGHGNVLAGASYLLGLAAEELSAAELEVSDPAFPIVVCARITKPLRI